MERICEPELMDEPLQAQAYAEADFSGSDQAFTERILELLAPHAPGTAASGSPAILDLGCGPGNISFRLAAALPQAPVVGLDGAKAMLAWAQRQQQQEPGRWPHLHFQWARLPLSSEDLLAFDALPAPFAPPYAVIVSNSLLHHLHDPAVLWQAVRQLAAPGALVVLRDLRRPPNPQALQEQVERHASSAPTVLRRDFANSLAAAFLPQEVEAQLEAAGLPHFQVASVDDRYLEVSGQLAHSSPR
jgi:trans-aconitate 2-methyltransferase